MFLANRAFIRCTMPNSAERIAATAILSPGDPAPFEVVNPRAGRALVITADHGGVAVPSRYRNFGLPPGELRRHIGWDIGAAGVARALAEHLGATAVVATYSRLLIDANRPLGDPECTPAVSDGTAIAANRDIGGEELLARAEEVYWPYHHAVDEQIARLRGLGHAPAVLAIHSFTPMLAKEGRPRPWHVGVMFSHDERLGRQIMAALARRHPDVIVGENVPYSGFLHGYAQKLHGLAQMLPHAQVEVRQDLIGDTAGQTKWAAILADALPV
jgi:predicted N-formylglutamate amidohydrolase